LYLTNKVIIFAFHEMRNIMEKFNGLKSQDILILLMIITIKKENWVLSEVATTLDISLSETSQALERCRICGLIDSSKKKVNRLNFREFLIYGLKYVYPAQIGSQVRGIATGYSAEPIKSKLSESNENLVWAYYKGSRRGNSVKPLYPTVPKIIDNNKELYELLVIVDTLRVGKVREREIAIEELDKRLNAQGN